MPKFEEREGDEKSRRKQTNDKTIVLMPSAPTKQQTSPTFISREWNVVDDEQQIGQQQQQRSKKVYKRSEIQSSSSPSLNHSQQETSNSLKRRFGSNSTRAVDDRGAFTSRGNFDRLKREQMKKSKHASSSENEGERVYNSMCERLIHTLGNQTHECVICCDPIKRHVATWSCTSCYNVLHLNCVRKWATQSMKDRQTVNWKCPSCRSIYSQVPSSYYCYCRKHVDPPHDMFLTPHSCGEECGRKRADPKCPHVCTAPCHPGPCLECPGMREEKCYCGKETFEVFCKEVGTNGISCNQVCGKPLNCGRHYCSQICHEGNCDSCSLVYEQSCFCGKKHDTILCVPCADEEKDSISGLLKTFSCDGQCPLILPCGHKCDRTCHAGKCITAAKAWDSTQTQDIDEYIRNHGCMQQCKKRLSCGHICRKKCHPESACSDTEQCVAKVNVTCTCGRMKEKMECSTVHSIIHSRYPEMTDFNIRSLPALLECDRKCRAVQKVKEINHNFEFDLETVRMPYYSPKIQEFARKEPQFIQMVEDILDELVLCDESEVQSYHFPPMSKWKRRMVYELAEKYGFHAHAENAEPNRAIFVLRKKTSARPVLVLSDVMNETERFKHLQAKLQERDEELAEQTLTVNQRRKEAKHAKEWSGDVEPLVFASNADFNISEFREVQKTKSAPSAAIPSATRAQPGNMWNMLTETNQ